MGIVKNIIEDNKFTPGDIPKLEGKLFWEGPEQRINLERFGMLLLLSTIIVPVIGAMIISFFLVLIVATATAMFMRDLKRTKVEKTITSPQQ